MIALPLVCRLSLHSFVQFVHDHVIYKLENKGQRSFGYTLNIWALSIYLGLLLLIALWKMPADKCSSFVLETVHAVRIEILWNKLFIRKRRKTNPNCVTYRFHAKLMIPTLLLLLWTTLSLILFLVSGIIWLPPPMQLYTAFHSVLFLKQWGTCVCTWYYRAQQNLHIHMY